MRTGGGGRRLTGVGRTGVWLQCPPPSFQKKQQTNRLSVKLLKYFFLYALLKIDTLSATVVRCSEPYQRLL